MLLINFQNPYHIFVEQINIKSFLGTWLPLMLSMSILSLFLIFNLKLNYLPARY